MRNSKILLKALKNNFSVEKSLEAFKKLDKTTRTNFQNLGRSFIDSFNKKPQGFGRFNKDKKEAQQEVKSDKDKEHPSKPEKPKEEIAKEIKKDSEPNKAPKDEKKQQILEELEKKMKEIMDESFKKTNKNATDSDKEK